MSDFLMDTLYNDQPGNTDTVIGDATPSNVVRRIIKCTATNDTTTAVTLSINKIPDGDSADPANLILNLRPLGSRETYECPEVVGQVLKEGTQLSAIASVAAQVTLVVDIVETVQRYT